MRRFYMFTLLFTLAAIPARAQSTTNTTCTGSGSQVNCSSNTIGGTNSMTNTTCTGSPNQINCTSNTIGGTSSTDSSALDAERARENYEAGQQVGSALGLAIGAGINAHRRHSYCKKYPGGSWRNPNGTVSVCSGVQQTAVSGQQPAQGAQAVCDINPTYSFCKAAADQSAFNAMTPVEKAKDYCSRNPDRTWYVNAQQPYVPCKNILAAPSSATPVSSVSSASDTAAQTPAPAPLTPEQRDAISYCKRNPTATITWNNGTVSPCSSVLGPQ